MSFGRMHAPCMLACRRSGCVNRAVAGGVLQPAVLCMGHDIEASRRPAFQKMTW